MMRFLSYNLYFERIKCKYKYKVTKCDGIGWLAEMVQIRRRSWAILAAISGGVQSPGLTYLN